MGLPFFGTPGNQDSGRLDTNVGGEFADTLIGQFGIDRSLFDAGTLFGGADRIPRTKTRLSHSLIIKLDGRVIGAAQGIVHTQARQVDDKWELGKGRHGQAPADVVPQNVITRTITLSRYDLFTRSFEQLLSQEFVSLGDQSRGFTFEMSWQSPVGIALGGRQVYQFSNCFFSRVGRTARVDDNRIIRVDGEITYGRIRRVV